MEIDWRLMVWAGINGFVIGMVGYGTESIIRHRANLFTVILTIVCLIIGMCSLLLYIRMRLRTNYESRKLKNRVL